MNFKLTKWKLIVLILLIILDSVYFHYFSADKDSNLVITLAPSIFVYLIWSLFEKNRNG
ncbi:MAG: hypothetical protein AABW89_05505 [Nanoarchaeota archaeon]